MAIGVNRRIASLILEQLAGGKGHGENIQSIFSRLQG